MRAPLCCTLLSYLRLRSAGASARQQPIRWSKANDVPFAKPRIFAHTQNTPPIIITPSTFRMSPLAAAIGTLLFSSPFRFLLHFWSSDSLCFVSYSLSTSVPASREKYSFLLDIIYLGSHELLLPTWTPEERLRMESPMFLLSGGWVSKQSSLL